MKTPIVLALAALCAAALPAHARSVVVNQALTEKEVLAAQQGWCKALVDISTTGARNGQPAAKALAEQFIAFASQPQTQKVFSENIPYGPVHRDALALLPADVQQQLPTAQANLAEARAVDAEFWVDHGEELEQRFNAWAAR